MNAFSCMTVCGGPWEVLFHFRLSSQSSINTLKVLTLRVCNQPKWVQGKRKKWGGLDTEQKVLSQKKPAMISATVWVAVSDWVTKACCSINCVQRSISLHHRSGRRTGIGQNLDTSTIIASHTDKTLGSQTTTSVSPPLHLSQAFTYLKALINLARQKGGCITTWPEWNGTSERKLGTSTHRQWAWVCHVYTLRSILSVCECKNVCQSELGNVGITQKG